MTLMKKEHAHAMNGVPGRMFDLRVPPAPWAPGTFGNQTWVSQQRPARAGYPKGSVLQVKARFDDKCRNGHNTFSITAEVRSPKYGGEAWGCLHDDIAKVFPELAGLIRWHLCSTDGPMFYVGNTVYLAGNRDHWGRAAGDPAMFEYGFRFGNSPVTMKVSEELFQFVEEQRLVGRAFSVAKFEHEKYEPHYDLAGRVKDWYGGFFHRRSRAEEFVEALNTCQVQPVKVAVGFSEGKARELDAAREAACWPDATDEELSVGKDELTAVLRARLPGLMVAFRADIEAAGFVWEAPT